MPIVTGFTHFSGAAKILNDIKDELNGNVKLVFQPAEEGVGGALPMIEDGILENPHVDAAFALHVEPLEKTGNIQVKDGSIMASPDDFKIVVHGVGGHASAPEKCVNPVTIGTAISVSSSTDAFLKLSRVLYFADKIFAAFSPI